MTPGTSSFADFLGAQAPDLLPSRRAVPAGNAGDLAPHGTTIVAATFTGGVVMAGDRRATMGNIIAQRDIQKVFPADEFSVVGIAGTAGLAVEMVRLFQTELEHYEKIEGTTLSMDGKANRLAALIRANLGLAMQGLAVVPLFAGFDLEADQGRIFSYDVTGGRYEETAFHSVGSGSLFARGSLKKLYRDDFDADEAVTGRHPGALRRRRRRLRDRRPRPHPADLPGRPPDHARRRSAHARRGGLGHRGPDDRLAHAAPRRPRRPPDVGARSQMCMPFYVSPEQLMKDRADFARKGIARGRSVVAVQYADGILFASENPSQALHKVSEIYDRIAFAAVGRYNEFENLRIAGVRLADMRGYAYDRRDVTGRGLANAYAQTLGTIFSSGGEKPYEVELFVAEIGDVAADDQLYRLTYDGQVADEHKFAVMGGAADVVATALREHYVEGASLEDAVRLAVSALGHSETEDRVIAADALEVAVLDRTREQPRKFLRLRAPRLTEILGDRGVVTAADPAPEDALAGAAPQPLRSGRPPGPDGPGLRRDGAAGGPVDRRARRAPPVAPPVAPRRHDSGPRRASDPTPVEPVDPASPGETPPPVDPSNPTH